MKTPALRMEGVCLGVCFARVCAVALHALDRLDTLLTCQTYAFAHVAVVSIFVGDAFVLCLLTQVALVDAARVHCYYAMIARFAHAVEAVTDAPVRAVLTRLALHFALVQVLCTCFGPTLFWTLSSDLEDTMPSTHCAACVDYALCA